METTLSKPTIKAWFINVKDEIKTLWLSQPVKLTYKCFEPQLVQQYGVLGFWGFGSGSLARPIGLD